MKLIKRIEPFLKLKSIQAELILSISWDQVNKDSSSFLEGMETLDELRMHHDTKTPVKYDREYFEGVF